MIEIYTQLREATLNLQKDVEKAEAGNETAARRLRRGLKTVKDLTKQLRDVTFATKTPEAAPALQPKG